MARQYLAGAGRNDTQLDANEQRFVADYARHRDGRAAAVRAGYPEHRSAEIADVLLADVGIRDAVLALVRGKDRKALRLQWEAEDDADLAASRSPDLSLALKVQHTRERLAATKLPPPGPVVIECRVTRAAQRAARRLARGQAVAGASAP